jgi:ABC-type Fe3+/spermidine/putrescine transport system ATPase subunit
MGLSNFMQARVERVEGETSVLQAFGQSFEAQGQGPVGETVEIALRPERIRLSHAGGTGTGVRGELTQAIYHGNASDYTVRLPDGQLLLVRQSNDAPADGSAPLVVGSPVWAHWPRSAVNVLQA